MSWDAIGAAGLTLAHDGSGGGGGGGGGNTAPLLQQPQPNDDENAPAAPPSHVVGADAAADAAAPAAATAAPANAPLPAAPPTAPPISDIGEEEAAAAAASAALALALAEAAAAEEAAAAAAASRGAPAALAPAAGYGAPLAPHSAAPSAERYPLPAANDGPLRLRFTYWLPKPRPIIQSHCSIISLSRTEFIRPAYSPGAKLPGANTPVWLWLDGRLGGGGVDAPALAVLYCAPDGSANVHGPQLQPLLAGFVGKAALLGFARVVRASDGADGLLLIAERRGGGGGGGRGGGGGQAMQRPPALAAAPPDPRGAALAQRCALPAAGADGPLRLGFSYWLAKPRPVTSNHGSHVSVPHRDFVQRAFGPGVKMPRANTPVWLWLDGRLSGSLGAPALVTLLANKQASGKGGLYTQLLGAQLRGLLGAVVGKASLLGFARAVRASDGADGVLLIAESGGGDGGGTGQAQQQRKRNRQPRQPGPYAQQLQQQASSLQGDAAPLGAQRGASALSATPSRLAAGQAPLKRARGRRSDVSSSDDEAMGAPPPPPPSRRRSRGPRLGLEPQTPQPLQQPSAAAAAAAAVAAAAAAAMAATEAGAAAAAGQAPAEALRALQLPLLEPDAADEAALRVAVVTADRAFGAAAGALDFDRAARRAVLEAVSKSARDPDRRWSLVCLDYPRLREACADGDAEWARKILEQL